VGVACDTNGEEERIYFIVGEPQGKRPLGRLRHWWVGILKIDLRVIGWGGVDQIGLAQDMDRWRTLMNAVMTLFWLKFLYFP
jgi:hypothetical protein